MTKEEFNDKLKSLGMTQIEFCRYVGICQNFTYMKDEGRCMSPYLVCIIDLMIENKKLREVLERVNDQ